MFKSPLSIMYSLDNHTKLLKSHQIKINTLENVITSIFIWMFFSCVFIIMGFVIYVHYDPVTECVHRDPYWGDKHQ